MLATNEIHFYRYALNQHSLPQWVDGFEANI